MKTVIGIDLGGTKIRGAVVNSEGEVIRDNTVLTRAQQGKEAVIEQLAEVIHDFARDLEISAVGIGTAGCVNVSEGVVEIGVNISDWKMVPLAQELEARTNLPIVVDNDANVAALSEAWVGAGQDFKSFLMITCGTGVGGAFYSKDFGIWRGNNWTGGEIGHSVLYPNGIPCNCGQRGCADLYISGRAVERRYYESTGVQVDGRTVFAQARKGDKESVEVVADFVNDMAVFMTSMKNILDPEAFIIGGGLINERDMWWQPLIDVYHNSCFSSANTIIVPAAGLNDAGCLGAAKLAFDYLEGRI